MPMTTQWGQREVTDSHLRITALFSVSSMAATGVWLVSLSIIGKKIQLVCQCHCHFTDLLVSLSIGASGTILQSHRGWNGLCDFFPHWSHWLEIFHWSHWLKGERGTERVTVNGSPQKLSFDASTFWPIWITKAWNRARLSRFRSLSEQPDENSQGAITSEADPWKSQCCDPSNSLPGLIYSWAALRGPQTNVKSTVTPSLMNSADGAKTLNSILASGRVSLWRSKDLKQRQQRWWWWWHTPWLQTLWNCSGVAGKLRGPTVVPSSPRAR